jgi:hypothetical protein
MSDLLNKASLVVIPSGYKEDTVYSVVPTDGSGDLSFTRASNGTRVNSAGLVEVCPWNLLQQSENFSALYSAINSTISNNTTTAPNGTTTADSLIENTATDNHFAFGDSTQQSGVEYTYSVYAKSIGGRNIRISGSSGYSGAVVVDLSNGSVLSGSGVVENVGNGWYRISITATTTTTTIRVIIYAVNGTSLSYTGNGTSGVYLWGGQLNIGSTAKPYFPTTDRLNVPRLTYQNGGGGCPSLLLEKQSTNLLQYSQDLANAWFAIFDATATGNSAISPDGTQNATNLSFDAVASARLERAISGTYESQTHTISVYAKVTSGTQTFRLKCTHAGVVDYLSSDLTVTTEWQRFTFTQAFGATVGSGIVGGIQNGSNSTAKNILFYGFQLEPNTSYVTSYIPTTAASATRVADACFKTGISSLIGQTGGVWFADYILNGQTSNANILNSEKNTTCALFMSQQSDGDFDAGLYVSGSLVGRIVAPVGLTVGQRVKVAYAYESGNIALYINGNQAGVLSSTFTFPTTLDDIFLSDEVYFNYPESIKFNQVAIFKTRLTNAELASITTI